MNEDNLKIGRDRLSDDAEDMQLLLEMLKEAKDLQNEAQRVLYNYAVPDEGGKRANRVVTAETDNEKEGNYIWEPAGNQMWKRRGMLMPGEKTHTKTYIGTYTTFKEPPLSNAVRYTEEGYFYFDYGMNGYLNSRNMKDTVPWYNFNHYCLREEHEYEYTITYELKGSGIVAHVRGFRNPFWDILKSVKEALYNGTFKKISRDEDDGWITHQEKQELIAALDFDYDDLGIAGDDFDTKDPVWIFENFIVGISDGGTLVAEISPEKLGMMSYYRKRRDVFRYSPCNGAGVPYTVTCPLQQDSAKLELSGNWDFLSADDELAYLKKGLYRTKTHSDSTTFMFLPTINAQGQRMAQTIDFDIWLQDPYSRYLETSVDRTPLDRTPSELFPSFGTVFSNFYADDIDYTVDDPWIWEKDKDIENFPEIRTLLKARVRDEDGWVRFKNWHNGEDFNLWYPRRNMRKKIVQPDFVGWYGSHRISSSIEDIIMTIYIPQDHITYGRYTQDGGDDPWDLFLARNPGYTEHPSTQAEYTENARLLKAYFLDNFSLDYLAEAMEGYIREEAYPSWDIPPSSQTEIAKIKVLITKLWSTISWLISLHENEQR